jgi:hypothetical protein
MFRLLLLLYTVALSFAGSPTCSVESRIHEWMQLRHGFAFEADNKINRLKIELNKEKERLEIITEYLNNLFKKKWIRTAPVFTEEEKHEGIIDSIKDAIIQEQNRPGTNRDSVQSAFINEADSAYHKYGGPLLARLLTKTLRHCEMSVEEFETRIANTRSDYLEFSDSFDESWKHNISDQITNCVSRYNGEISRGHLILSKAMAWINELNRRSSVIQTSISLYIHQIYPSNRAIILDPSVRIIPGFFEPVFFELFSPSVHESHVDTFLHTRLGEYIAALGGAVYADTLLYALLDDYRGVYSRLLQTNEDVIRNTSERIESLERSVETLLKDKRNVSQMSKVPLLD